MSAQALEGVEAVVNLMGEGIADAPWTEKRKKNLRDSRVQSTHDLIRSFEDLEDSGEKLKVFVSFSAVGFYGDRADDVLTETSSQGEGFLAELCAEWEETAREVLEKIPQARLVIPRLGVVLGECHGFLDRLERVFRSGVGGKLGDGEQFLSWIHIQDVVNFVSDSLSHQDMEGIFNLCAPHPVTNKELTKALAKAFQVKAFAPVPKFVLKAVYGEMSEALLFSQRVVSEKRNPKSFQFQTLESALEDLYGDLKKNEARLLTHLWVPQKPEDIWDFFSSETNLEEITPKNLNFKVLGKSTEAIEEGTLIDYKLKIHGVPAKWKTRIRDWDPPHEFVDEQLSGPYKRWVHHHGLKPFRGGTLLTDRVRFQLPLGSMGRMGGFAFVRQDVEKIFSYRSQVVWKKFGSKTQNS